MADIVQIVTAPRNDRITMPPMNSSHTGSDEPGATTAIELSASPAHADALVTDAARHPIVPDRVQADLTPAPLFQPAMHHPAIYGKTMGGTGVNRVNAVPLNLSN
ncbi:hypothetical protein NP284_24965 [Rhodopseudomonas pseudopalustris]|uniref:hypothetical protein n=1 Tax=Rhodopseudomonas pseudopalustris TaxID=1513892 RepID=UPI003F95CF3E